MKKSSFQLLWIVFSTAFCPISAWSAGPEAKVAGAWVELRNAPLFGAPATVLAPTWGPSLPTGTKFQIEKSYGRWLYGTPVPLTNMKKQDFAPAGWIYSRMLLPEGDESVQGKAEQKTTFLTAYYARKIWAELGLKVDEESIQYFNTLENVGLSKKALQMFKLQDETSSYFHQGLPLLPSAQAAEEEKIEKSLGLIGADLDFLQQEFRQINTKKNKEVQVKNAKILRPPVIPAADIGTKTNLMGRYLAYRSLKLPTLSHEEIDGSLYMQAVARRVLDACSEPQQKLWKNQRWQIFRFMHLQSEGMPQNAWLQFELPGHYFAVSAKAIALASNEAELAFLLARPFLRAAKVKHEKITFSKKGLAENLRTMAPEVWEKIQRNQSTKLSENLDIGDEVEMDLATMTCMARAGYNPDAGITYLKKLAASKDQSWSKWFHENNIGIDYRMERTAKLLKEEKAKAQIANATVVNKKRFQKAVELWNYLP